MRASPRETAPERQPLLETRELVCQASDTGSVTLNSSRPLSLRLGFGFIAHFNWARCHPNAFIKPQPRWLNE